MQLPADSDDYRHIFLHDIPVLDTRAPVEFARGAFPNAVNIPLMTDSERAEVGVCYKERGQQAAIELGHQLVQGEIKARRVAAWEAFANQYPQGYLYCFRGGMRSKISQQWLAESGVNYPRIVGGYKAMRRFLIEQLERSVSTTSFVLVSGATGSGKTRAIEAVDSSIDLEGLANHRGSAFGHLIEEQPTQINFENALSIELLKKRAANRQARIYLEDEGRVIGRVSLPESLCNKMESSPLLVIEEGFESRLDVLVEDYVVDLGRRFQKAFAGETCAGTDIGADIGADIGTDGDANRAVTRAVTRAAEFHRDKLLDDLSRIKKRLGSERYLKTSGLLQQAFEEQQRSGLMDLHRQWIAILLAEYYDPMYEYQLARRQGEIIYRGSREEIITWIDQQR